jgi:hypothetical protein
MMNVQNDIGKIAKEMLRIKIEGKMVALRDITPCRTERHGHFYANVFLGDIHINAWSLQHKYTTVSKNGKYRRLSESDSHAHDTRRKSKGILPNIYPSILDSSFISSSPKQKDNFILPEILLPEIRPSSSSSSTIQTDCFLSHNWGENKTNHQVVSNINVALKKRGISTWLDENKINGGSIRFKMAEGIDNTKCVLVFITKEYREKVNGIDMKDNCKYEFTYAVNQLGAQNMIPIIMEPEMKDTRKWKGELGAALGSMLYIDFSSDIISNPQEEIEKKYDELYRRIQQLLNRQKKYSNK